MFIEDIKSIVEYIVHRLNKNGKKIVLTQ